MLLPFRRFVALRKTGVIRGNSMGEALRDGDEFYTEKIIGLPQINDIVLAIVDREWRDESDKGHFYIVKRVVGVKVRVLVQNLINYLC